MSIPGAASPLFLATTAGGAAGAFEIARSLRFNSGDSAFLNRQPSSASNRKTWTWSGWVKRSASGTYMLFRGGTSANDSQYFAIQFNANDKLAVGAETLDYLVTTQVFRDFSAWYHIVVALDVNQGTNANKLKLYINGVEVTAFDTDNRSSLSTSDKGVNQTQAHVIGAEPLTSNRYLNGYLAEINFVDGSQLGATSFGQADANGVWQAKDTSGLTFGTNGFRLKFADNSSNAALGTDSSSNSNTWTVNNLVATAGLATANQGFDVVTYSGNSGTQSISSLAFQPDFVWCKGRSFGGANMLFDSVRGATKRLVSNQNLSEGTVQGVTSFNSNGFTLGSDADCNYNGQTHVAWCWKAGGAAVSNTDGSITSQVSANNTYGFSIVSYSAADAAVSVGHGLSNAPKMIFTKPRNAAVGWKVYHSGLAGADAASTYAKDYYLTLNATNMYTYDANYWGSAGSNSTTFGTHASADNALNDMIAYCWSEVAGFSKFGSFTSATNGTTVSCGFKPRFILIKSTGTGSWAIHDAARNNFGSYLLPDTSGAEGNNSDFTVSDTGFTFDNNSNGTTFIFAAFAAKPDGSIIDSLVDTPTNAATPSDSGVGNEVVGNYCTLNPLAMASGLSLSNGNLDAAGAAVYGCVTSTIFAQSGKYYFEFTLNTYQNDTAPGVVSTDANPHADYLGAQASSVGYLADGRVFQSGSATSYSSYAAGDVIGVAFDVDTGKIWFAKNNTWLNSGNPAAGTNQVKTITGGKPLGAGYRGVGSGAGSFNFGQRAFAFSAPTNFKALNTANLPTPTIADGSKYFDAKLYTGNGGTQTISGYGFSPDWLWIKSRSGADNHALQDVVRGATRVLQTNTENAEVNASNTVGSFTSDGFTLAGNAGSTNGNNVTYAGWAWDGGTGSPVTNNDGSIASQVRASAASGFSIVKYTANGTNGATIGHGLNAKPYFMIGRQYSAASGWGVYHNSVGNTGALHLNNLTSTSTSSIWWNNTSPSNSVFTIGTVGAFNTSGEDVIFYCFAPVANYSQMGNYLGNGSDNGPFVFTGFKPRLIITKAYSSNSNNNSHWLIYDTLSDSNPHNEADTVLYANLSNPLNTHANMGIDILSNGFRLKADTSGYSNNNGWDYLYYAVAENPFQANGGLAR